MELKQGYKQTEVGVIPEDWEIRTLGDLFSFKNGLNKGKRFFGSGTPIINYMDVYSNTGILYKDIKGRVNVNHSELKSFEVKKGDVFFTRTSETVEEVGIPSVILDDPINTVFSGFLLRARSKTNYLENQFKKYCFSSNFIRTKIIASSSYTTRALTNGRLLSKISIPCPPIYEQSAIATVLSDTDALIESLEKLIAKKRLIKQGAMQELLTGMRRLPGFVQKTGYKQTEVGVIPEDWEVKKLGVISEIIMGQSPQSSNYNTKGEGLPLIQGMADISNRKTIKRIFTREFTKLGRIGNILLSVRAPVGKVSKTTFDVCLGRGVCAIRNTNEYLFHYLIYEEKNWSNISRGSTFDSVNSHDIKELLISIPSNLKEQSSIATVLSDMDAEIEVLESRLEMTRALKQGMMQELLTGRIRLL